MFTCRVSPIPGLSQRWQLPFQSWALALQSCHRTYTLFFQVLMECEVHRCSWRCFFLFVLQRGYFGHSRVSLWGAQAHFTWKTVKRKPRGKCCGAFNVGCFNQSISKVYLPLLQSSCFLPDIFVGPLHHTLAPLATCWEAGFHGDFPSTPTLPFQTERI